MFGGFDRKDPNRANDLIETLGQTKTDTCLLDKPKRTLRIPKIRIKMDLIGLIEVNF
jgi:hypothetical protein